MRKDIDFVFLWCDGADPKFLEQKKKRMKEVWSPTIEEENGNVRFEQFDELKYALRSIWKYAPWFHRIYLVTNNQVPNWLKQCPKISIVDHKDIIPSQYRPSFSSICIEMFLDRIPDLSEFFVYSNDDMILNRPVVPSDFFDKADKPLVWVNCRYAKKREKSLKQMFQDATVEAWFKSLICSWNLYRKKREAKFLFLFRHMAWMLTGFQYFVRSIRFFQNYCAIILRLFAQAKNFRGFCSHIL